MIRRVSNVNVPQPRAGEQLSPPSDLGAAYTRVAVAYRLARRAVFDMHPHGIPDESDLTDAQRVLLTELRNAELELDQQRRLRWQRSDVGVEGHPVA